MSAIEDLLSDEIAAITIETNQTAQVNLSNGSPTTNAQDISNAFDDNENDHNKDNESSAGLEHESGGTERSDIDTLFENCEQLPEDMEKMMVQLDFLIYRRARFRALHSNPAVEKKEICLVSDRRWRRHMEKLEIEWATSFSLGHVQTDYRGIQQTVQTTLEIHNSLLESAAYESKPGYRERADAAVLKLEQKATSFDSIVRRLLHTIYLPDGEAWKYSENLSQALYALVYELRE